MSLSTALVTGGSGFLGRALLQGLKLSGVRTTVLARPSSAVPPNADTIFVADLRRETVRAALVGRSFDVIIHLAGYGVAPQDRDPEQIFDSNIAGTDAVVTAAQVTGTRAIVYLGSCSEYRPPMDNHPLVEDAPLGPDGLYGSSKAAAGLWGAALASQWRIAFQWLRLFNVFGPGEAPHRLLPSIISRLQDDETVALSRGEQVRDFLYIDDAVTGIILAARAALEGRLGPFNLCSGKAITVKEIAIAVAEAMGKPTGLLAFGALRYRPDDSFWLVGCPERFRRATGFVPQTSLIAGIERTIATTLYTEGSDR